MSRGNMPPDSLARAAELLARRPELAGIGLAQPGIASGGEWYGVAREEGSS